MVLMMGPELILYHVRGTDCVEKKKKKLMAKRKAERYFLGYIITERIIFFIVFHNFPCLNVLFNRQKTTCKILRPIPSRFDYTWHKPSLLPNFQIKNKIHLCTKIVGIYETRVTLLPLSGTQTHKKKEKGKEKKKKVKSEKKENHKLRSPLVPNSR